MSTLRAFTATVALTASLLGTTGPAEARSTNPVNRGVHVIGDSITNKAHAYHWSPLNAADRPPGWTVDAQPGRNMVALVNPYTRASDEPTLRRHIRALTPRATKVSTIVVALGTNIYREEMTEAEASQWYAKAIRTLRTRPVWNPGGKRIVLVTPWRHPDRDYSDRTRLYTDAIYRVARNSSGVCVMGWHEYADKHRNLIPDGVHPNQLALKVWRNMLYRAIKGCHQ